jgi:alkanesulfonate monooxygenase SsuD/methylene tetrahydromethanopterin reductase-like flavin-dependent oxidoreductase (luciferase family)
MLIDIQFSSAHNDWPVLRDAVRRAEADGYDTTWVFDHFDGGVLNGDRDMLECFTLLGALAAATTTIGIGPLVANVANRHPAVLAAAAATTHRISGGRLRLGIGAGAAPGTAWAREHDARGISLEADLEKRHAAVVRQIEAVRQVCDVRVIVGVNSVELATIAGTHADGVNVRLTSGGAEAQLGAARRAAGDRLFETSGWAMVDDTESQRRAEQWGLDRLILTSLDPLAVPARS